MICHQFARYIFDTGVLVTGGQTFLLIDFRQRTIREQRDSGSVFGSGNLKALEQANESYIRRFSSVARALEHRRKIDIKRMIFLRTEQIRPIAIDLYWQLTRCLFSIGLRKNEKNPTIDIVDYTIREIEDSRCILDSLWLYFADYQLNCLSLLMDWEYSFQDIIRKGRSVYVHQVFGNVRNCQIAYSVSIMFPML